MLRKLKMVKEYSMKFQENSRKIKENLKKIERNCPEYHGKF